MGTGLGPLVASVMTSRLADDGDAWRWVFWHQAIVGGVLVALIITLFKESRGSIVLSRKAKILNKWYEAREDAGYYGVWLLDPEPLSGAEGLASDSDNAARATGPEDEEKRTATAPAGSTTGSTTDSTAETVVNVRLRWLVKSDSDRATVGRMISVSLYRPFHLLWTEPVVFWFSAWVSFAWAVLYLTFSSVPYVFKTVYGWDTESTGYMFTAIMIGGVLSTVIGVFQDDLLKHPQWKAENWDPNDPSCGEESRVYAILRRHFPVEAPESRLYFTCLTASLLPLGLFIFGFTSRETIHWISPAVALCLASMGIYSVYLATFNYLADFYQGYASSALAAQSCCRNLLGGVFPLVTLPLFENLGIERAGGLLGGIALGLTFVPWVLVFFGNRIRARSSFAVGLQKLP